jgi:disulfide oxidoreductase YuzD
MAGISGIIINCLDLTLRTQEKDDGMKLNTKEIKRLIVTKLLYEEAMTEVLRRDYPEEDLPADYFDEKNWKREKKATLNNEEEEDDKLGFMILASRPRDVGDCYREYKEVTFPTTCRVFKFRAPFDSPSNCGDAMMVIYSDETEIKAFAFCFE